MFLFFKKHVGIIIIMIGLFIIGIFIGIKINK